MEIISGERIWTEWAKILNGNFGSELTLKMIELGLAPLIGLPESPNVQEFDQVTSKAKKSGLDLHPITKIAALLATEEEMMDLNKRLKFSGFERDLGLFIIANCKGPAQPNVSNLKFFQCIIADHKSKPLDCKKSATS